MTKGERDYVEGYLSSFIENEIYRLPIFGNQSYKQIGIYLKQSLAPIQERYNFKLPTGIYREKLGREILGQVTSFLYKYTRLRLRLRWLVLTKHGNRGYMLCFGL